VVESGRQRRRRHGDRREPRAVERDQRRVAAERIAEHDQAAEHG
jgi:hypothetical protein